MFLILMVIGLAGLGAMALPALGRHGGIGHGAHAAHAAHSLGTTKALVHHGGARASATRFVPSPRLVFSMLALYGAFGNVLLAAHLALWIAAIVAIAPAAIVERFAVTPLWRTLGRFEDQAAAPLEALVMSEATAVTPFRGGRGVVSIVRDGRLVQFSARLIDAQTELPVAVGDRLLVEDIDPARERVTVSVVDKA